MSTVKAILNSIVILSLLLGQYVATFSILNLKDTNPAPLKKIIIEIEHSFEVAKMTLSKFITMEHLSLLLISMFFASIVTLYMLRDGKTSNDVASQN